jgi:plasmid replication initiation protein
MISIKDVNALNEAFTKLAEADNRLSGNRFLNMVICTRATSPYFVVFISGNELTKYVGLSSEDFLTPMEAVDNVLKKASKFIEET